MATTQLRVISPLEEARPPHPDDVVDHLDLDRPLNPSALTFARLVQRQCDADLGEILVSEGHITEETLLRGYAAMGLGRYIAPEEMARLTPVVGRHPVPQLLADAALPVLTDQGELAVLTCDPFALGAGDGPYLLAPRASVQGLVAKVFRPELTTHASARVPAEESCRTWQPDPRRRMVIVALVVLALSALAFTFPKALFSALALWAVATLLISAALRLAAYLAEMSAPARPPQAEMTAPHPPLPKVSLLVPLFRETEMAQTLVNRLSRLTYPKCQLDVLLIVEEEDDLTRAALAALDLPRWVRVITAPDGQPRTKPRAMNYALDFCKGDIIGVFDAEDAPEPDQITKVARRFQIADPEVACLQGVLDYYNPRQSWLARCFTIEYATWFRVMLPGMVRLGFAIPLGGTTLFFRRKPLEDLGGWDAHNVTEDADLGFRLARHGYRTEMIDAVTGEEANCYPRPWIKQRSRWLKGYMKTYLVHMRRPRLLLAQLGVRKFIGFQAHFVSAVSQVLLAPLLWSFWLLFFGLPHPLEAYIAFGTLATIGGVFMVVEILGLVFHATAVSGRDHAHLLPWVPTMHLYAPLAMVAAYKALYELIVAPFFWDKTAHGHSLEGGEDPALKAPILLRSV